MRLLMASLRLDWSNTIERFFYSTVFAVASGNTIVATNFPMRSHIALLCNTWATCKRLEKSSTHVEKKARSKKLQQRLGDLPVVVLLPVSPAPMLWTKMQLMDEDVFSDMLWA